MIIKTFGERLKRIRNLMGLTQKELSQKAGFSITNSTSEICIRQYEGNIVRPKAERIQALAEALGVDVSALFTAEIQSQEELLHILFELKDIYNLKIAKKDKSYLLSFDDLENTDLKLQIYLEAWLDKQEQFDLGACSKKEYDLWCGKFPNVAEVNINEEDLKVQLAEKQKELEIQIEKMQKETERKIALLKAIKTNIEV